MARKKKKKEDDLKLNLGGVSDSDLTLTLPGIDDDVGGSAPPKPAPRAQKPVSAPPSRSPSKPITKPVSSRPSKTKTVPKKLAPLPELPAFVKPEDIKREKISTFNLPPQEGKGKIKEITWNIRMADQAANQVTRTSRALSPLMEEALNQVQALRNTIKQNKPGEGIGAPKVTPAPRVTPTPKKRPAPSTPRKVETSPQPRKAPKPQPSPSTRPKPKPQSRPKPSAPARQKPTVQRRDLGEVDLSRPNFQEKPIPKKEIRSSLTSDTLQAQQPLQRTSFDEAKPVMGSGGRIKQEVSPFSSTRTGPTPSPTPQEASRVPPEASGGEPSQEAYQPTFAQIGGKDAETKEMSPTKQGTGKDKVLPGGRKICGRCGGSRFREENDKSKPLSFTPPFLYAKKFICKDCGKVFNQDSEEKPKPAPGQQQPVQRSKAVTAAPVHRAEVQQARQVSWVDSGDPSVKVEPIKGGGNQNVKPSSVFAREGWKSEPLPQGQSSGGGTGISGAPARGQLDSSQPEHEGEGMASGRLVCPKCGSTSFNKIEDKSQPISYGLGSGMGVMYKKVHQCKKCGTKVD